MLNHAMRVMKDRNEPFTFLMPVSEDIYKPFGFTFVYNQESGQFMGTREIDSEIRFVLAEKQDCKDIAVFANASIIS